MNSEKVKKIFRGIVEKIIPRCYYVYKREGDNTMASVFDVAKYILNKNGKMSTWKLQKLCYYAQAWSLAWTEAPLFDEDFQAWANGPVCPQLFAKHKGKFVVNYGDIKLGDIDNLDDDQKDTIDKILEYYGSMEPYELREQSHSEAPWRTARGTLPEGALCDTVITKDSMGEYYGKL
mgnify:CR=1 FL=1